MFGWRSDADTARFLSGAAPESIEILAMTPIEYLTRLRLHRAHQDLRTADPETSTVSKIAVNWGFWHFGEFAAAYKSCFDEMPSETLNQ